MKKNNFKSCVDMAADVAHTKKGGVATWWRMDTLCGMAYVYAPVYAHECVRVRARMHVCGL